MKKFRNRAIAALLAGAVMMSASAVPVMAAETESETEDMSAELSDLLDMSVDEYEDLSAGDLKDMLENADSSEIMALVLGLVQEVLSEEGQETDITKWSDSIGLQMESNPTTGYDWTVETENDCVEVESLYMPDETDDKVTGAGGITEFTITPKAAGTCTVTFSYERSWEKEPAEEKIYVFEVNDDLQIRASEDPAEESTEA